MRSPPTNLQPEEAAGALLASRRLFLIKPLIVIHTVCSKTNLHFLGQNLPRSKPLHEAPRLQSPVRHFDNNQDADMLPSLPSPHLQPACTSELELWLLVALVSTSIPRMAVLSSLDLQAKQRVSSPPSKRITRRYMMRLQRDLRRRTIMMMDLMARSW